MTKRRKWLLGSLAVLAMLSAAVLLIPFCRSGILGLLRNERFYRGRPTSYWRSQAERYCNWRRPFYGWEGSDWVSEEDLIGPATWLDECKRILGLKYRIVVLDDFPLQEGDPKAVPVLLDLLKDPAPGVRVYAALGLSKIGPGARQAISALTEALKDEDYGSVADLPVRRQAAEALGYIGPEAGEAVPALRAMAANDRDYSVRMVATWALKLIDPATIDE